MRGLRVFLLLLAAGCGGGETRRDTGQPETGNEAAGTPPVTAADGEQDAAGPAAPRPAVDPPATPAPKKINPTVVHFIRHNADDEHEWCAIDLSTGAVSVLRNYGADIVVEPALWGGGQRTVFAVRHKTRPRLVGTIDGKRWEVAFPPGGSLTVRHPSISRDGRLLAFTLQSGRHVGNIDVYNWDTGLYTGTFMGVAFYYKIVSVNLQTGKQQAVYHDDELVPDVMKKRGLGPAFSPAADILVYADSYRIYVCEGTSGKELKTFEVPQISLPGWTGKGLISEESGLAFAPDGQSIAYLTQGEADIANRPFGIVRFEIETGRSAFYAFPDPLRAAAVAGLMTLDFSPDASVIAFSGSAGGTGPAIYILNTTDGNVLQCKAAGRCFSPVWKGR